MTRRLRLADASRALQPFQQGELDSLCGLYAVINAVRVTIWPRRLNRIVAAELLTTGLRSLSRSRKLLRGLTIGIDEPTLRKVCDAVIEQANYLLDVHLVAVRPPLTPHWSSAHAIRFIRSKLRAGSPVIVGFEGRLDHWTLVVRHSATRVILHDSSNLHWVSVAAICIVGDGTDKPHPITDDGLIAIALNAPRPAVAVHASAPQRRTAMPGKAGRVP